MTAVVQDGFLKGRHVTSEVILWALRWYPAFPIRYRDLAAMLLDRGVSAKPKVCAGVDHATLFRWVQAHAAELEQRIRRHLRPCTGSWRVDETDIKVKGVWTYLHRVVNSLGQCHRLPALGAARCRIGQAVLPQGAGPAARREPTHDHRGQEPSLPRAAADMADMERVGEPWRFSKLRQRKYLNNIVEQDHRRVKRLVQPGLGFGGLETAKWALAGYEAMAVIRKGQVHNVGGRDMQAQAAPVAGLFKVAA